MSYTVSVRGVQLDIGGVLALEAMLSAEAGTGAATEEKGAVEVAATATGRPRSDKWAVWVSELAAYIHDEGVPEGLGAEGQDLIIGAIESRLIERGLEGLGRSTVQPVVRAVLMRLRSAGN